jgi:hypothetical protein
MLRIVAGVVLVTATSLMMVGSAGLGPDRLRLPPR